MSQPFIGTISMFAGNFAPRGWMTCDGQLLSIAQNTALFSILGTSFGGNGQTTFGLPDLRGRVPIHWGQGPGLSTYVLGEQSGSENITLTQSQMPMHTHLVGADATGNGQVTPQNTILGNLGRAAAEKFYSSAAPNTTMNPAMIAAAGGNQPFSIVQPFLCVTFIIAVTGIFPSRN
jgi:microcystin-dependent protein